MVCDASRSLKSQQIAPFHRSVWQGLYSQFLRVRRICSKLIDCCKNAIMLSTPLSKNAPTYIANIPINKNNENYFYLVTTENPANPPIREIIEGNWTLLSKSKTTRTLEDAKIIFGRRQNKNLVDYLVRASTRTHGLKSNVERNPCMCTRICRYCPIINFYPLFGHIRRTSELGISQFYYYSITGNQRPRNTKEKISSSKGVCPPQGPRQLWLASSYHQVAI